MRRAWLLALLSVVAIPSAAWARPAKPRTALVYVKTTMKRDVTTDAVWIASVDGSHGRRLAAGYGPKISPDGRRVAFLRSEPRALYVISTRPGIAPRLLARGVDDFVWSPDSTHLGALLGNRLAVVDVATRGQRTIARAPDRFSWFLSFGFSPSGRQLVWVRKVRTMGTEYTGDLFRAPVRGGPIKRLTRGGRAKWPVWGPNRIVFSALDEGAIALPARRPFKLWTIGSDGKRLRQLSRRPYLVPVAWSANGSRLLACSISEFSCAPVAVDPQTGAARLIRGVGSGPVVTSAISRTGRLILVNDSNSDNPDRITQIPYRGGAAKVLVRRAQAPDWNR
jgi:hypothetical protein